MSTCPSTIIFTHIKFMQNSSFKTCNQSIETEGISNKSPQIQSNPPLYILSATFLHNDSPIPQMPVARLAQLTFPPNFESTTKIPFPKPQKLPFFIKILPLNFSEKRFICTSTNPAFPPPKSQSQDWQGKQLSRP